VGPLARALAGGVAALVLAGCGNALSQEEYDKRGGAVLRKAVVVIEADKAEIEKHPEDPAVYRKLAADLRQFADDLDAVGSPPAHLTRRHDRIIDKMREGADLWDDAAAALARGDTERFQELADEALKTIDAAAGGPFG
jgi:hypothetical protein